MTTLAYVPFTATLQRSVAKLFARITDAIDKYAKVQRTYAELDALSTDSLLDLDLYRGDLKKTARTAVYHN